jgi:hypothetical protein
MASSSACPIMPFAAHVYFRFKDPQLHAKFFAPVPTQGNLQSAHQPSPQQPLQQHSSGPLYSDIPKEKQRTTKKTARRVGDVRLVGRSTPTPPPFDKDDLKRLRRPLFDMIVKCGGHSGTMDDEIVDVVCNCQFEESKSGVPIVNDFHLDWIMRDILMDLQTSVEFLVDTEWVSWNQRMKAVVLPRPFLDLAMDREDSSSYQTAKTSLLSQNTYEDDSEGGYRDCQLQDEKKEECDDIVILDLINDNESSEKDTLDWEMYLQLLKEETALPEVHFILNDIVYEQNTKILSPCVCPDDDFLPSCLCEGCRLPGMYHPAPPSPGAMNDEILDLPPLDEESSSFVNDEAWMFSTLSTLDFVFEKKRK